MLGQSQSGTWRGRIQRYWTLLLLCVAIGFSPFCYAQSTQHDIVLMLDNSGSMRKNDPEFLTRIAVQSFIDGLEDDVHVAVIAFDQQVTVLRPLTTLNTENRAELIASLDQIDYRGLLTNSPAALERSVYELRVNGRPDSRKSIVFMTDGIVDVAPEGIDPGDVEKARWMKSTLTDEAIDSAVKIFGIAFTDNADFELIQTLAKRTGGEYYRAFSAAEIDGVFANIRARLSAETVLLSDQKAPATPATEVGSNLNLVVPGTTSTETSTSLPMSSLPDGELPNVKLPEVNLRGVDTISIVAESLELKNNVNNPSDVLTSTSNDTDSPSSIAETNDSNEAPIISSSSSSSSKPAVQTRSTPTPPNDDSRFYMALIVGIAALALALAAIFFLILRRKSATANIADDGLMPKAFLNDIGEITERTSYEVGIKPVVVGRLRGSDSEAADYIVIDESTVGRRHALIEYKEHSFWVADQNSLNGTFVNNARIESATRLKHGDRLRFHRHEFEFIILDMLETDRTTMSETVFADLSSMGNTVENEIVAVYDDDHNNDESDDKKDDSHVPSPEDPTVT